MPSTVKIAFKGVGRANTQFVDHIIGFPLFVWFFPSGHTISNHQAWVNYIFNQLQLNYNYMTFDQLQLQLQLQAITVRPITITITK